MKPSIPVLILLCLASHAVPATEAAKIELHVIQTTTLTDEQFLTGAGNGTPLSIAGELRLPRAGTDRLPAMIIVHGSGGITGNFDRWSRELNDLGIATFLLDGFTPRGIVTAGTDQSQLGRLTMINDAFRALELLAKHPRIDARRIGIIGGSRGGVVALYASLKRFQRMYAPPAQFAAYVALYPPCYVTYLEETDVAAGPVRVLHGTADDYAPVAPCRDYVARSRRAGNDIQLIEYPGAHHAFDNPLTPVTRLERNQTVRSCEFEEKPLGRIVNRKTGRSFSFDDPCIERGVSMGYDARAHSQAILDVRSLLEHVFK
jgi:dienelactone hydrolase